MTLRGWLRFVGVLVLVAVVQVGVLDGITVAGAHPDLFLLVAVVCGLAAGPQLGSVMAFVSGLVADLFVPTPYGLSALCFVLVAFAVGLAAGLPGGRAPYSFKVVTALLGSIGGTLLYAGLETLLGQPHLDLGATLVICLVVAVGNAILVIPTAALVTWAVTAGSSGSSRDLASLAGGSATSR
ncbi:MAG: rod shape-determining protein MreD [Actinomycetota bacterium]|nr:rod shape-determining protein MreD [Actinomycetota bacterium]